MKLVTYQRPGLAWPTLGRLTDFQDEIDRFFEPSIPAWVPALDAYEDKEGFTIRVELPGFKREDIAVSLQEGALVISGERPVEKLGDETEILRQERVFGKFTRALPLSAEVAGDKVKAVYKDGVLTVSLPKAEEAKPKQVSVTVS